VRTETTLPRLFDDESSREFFTEKYAKEQSPTARSVERAVLGHEVGLSGYTTVEQARELATRMNVMPGARVLDIGSGRGWPGAFLAQHMDCSIVLSDMPVAVLVEALARVGQGVRAAAIAADARSIPLRSEVIGAIVHADVF